MAKMTWDIVVTSGTVFQGFTDKRQGENGNGNGERISHMAQGGHTRS